ncbi:MAG: hypothetical protein AB7L66_00390 [Gemmatimonadales bacterium]
MTERDDDLRELFAEARRRDSAWIPSFERVRGGTARRPAGRRIGWLAALAVTASAVAGVVWYERQPAVPAAATVDLRMPTDFLLDVLGAETLETVPSIGSATDWFPTVGSKGSSL